MGQTRVTDAFVSATEAAEILGMSPPNVAKTLERRGLQSQQLTVGKLTMKVWLRVEVERVAQERRAKAAT